MAHNSLSPQDYISFDWTTLDSLVSQGTNLHRLRGPWGETPIVYVLSHVDTDKIEAYLPVFDLNIPDHRGRTALALAIDNPDLWSYIPSLLSNGADTEIEEYQTLSGFGRGIHPIEDMFTKYSQSHKNPESYHQALIALLQHTDQKRFCKNNSQGFLHTFLHKNQDCQSSLVQDFILNTDFTTQNKAKDNVLQTLLNSYYFSEELYSLIFHTQKNNLSHILKQKNKNQETAIHTYFDIFVGDEAETEEQFPDSIFLFFKEYLNIFYSSVKQEKSWQKFIQTKTSNGVSIQDYIDQSLNSDQERFQIILEQHVLNLKIKQPSATKIEHKLSFKI